MSEGTKIGEENSDIDLSRVVNEETMYKPDNMQGTRIGEMSEFEKSVLGGTSETTPRREASEWNFQEAVEGLTVDLQEGDIVKGTVRRIEKSGVTVDIGYKSDGFIMNSEFSSNPNENAIDLVAPGDEIYVSIVKLETREGFTYLSRQKAEYEMAWSTLLEAMKARDILEIRVVSKVQGGLVANYKGIRGFIPASHIAKQANDDFEQYIGKELEVCVLQADRRRRKVIFSYKSAQVKPKKEVLEQLFAELEVGQILEGTVTSIKDFGVFVDVGGVEGLVHISELSWSRVSHPSDVVTVADKVKVFVLGVDRDAHRISLGLKQLEKDPWVNAAEIFQIGDIVQGKVSRVLAFGAFVELESGLEGLIHVSEIANVRVENVSDYLSEGQHVSIRIIKLIPEEQKIGLSLKNVDVVSKPEVKEAVSPEAPAADSSVAEEEGGEGVAEPETAEETES